MNEFEGMDRLCALCGQGAIILYVIANVYFPARTIIYRLGYRTREMAIFFRKYLDLHIWLNAAAFFLVALHGHYADERNIILRLCMLVTLWLTIAGMAMHNYHFNKVTT